MEANIEQSKSLIEIYFITSIEKDFYKERNLDFIYSKNKNQNLNELKHTELFCEEIQRDKILYLNKLNIISFELSENQTFNNNILFKIKDGSKIYIYDCQIDYDFKNIINIPRKYFIYNFEIGELKKDKSISNDALIKDSITNIQTNLIEMKENSIPQNKMNFEEKFNFFLKGIKNNGTDDYIILLNSLLLDTFKEIENNHIKNKTKIDFVKLLRITKIIYDDIYIKSKDNNSNLLDINKCIDKFINLFELLLCNKLIFYNVIDTEKLKEYSILIKTLEEDKITSDKFKKFITIFYGYYEDDEKLMNDLNNQQKRLMLSNLYNCDLYKPKNNQIKEKLTNILFDNSKDLNEFFSILNKSDSLFDKLKLIINHFDIIKKLIKENDPKKVDLPIKFEDIIKLEETPILFQSFHLKISEFELSIMKEVNIKSIFDFSEIIKSFIKLCESYIGSKENYDNLLIMKKIYFEEKKINPDLMESLLKYINKLIHLNIIEMVKKNNLNNIDLINNLHEDDYFNDELYKVNEDDFNILNGIEIKKFLNENDELYNLYIKYEIWKLFCKNNNDTKKYISFFGSKLDNILYLELFYKIFPVSNYNYHSTEEIISWVEKNMATIDINILKNEKDKITIFNNMNILLQLIIKTHYDIDKFLSFLEYFFIEKIKFKNDSINGYKILNQLYIYFINNYNIENNNSIPFNVQNKLLSFYIKNSNLKIDNIYLLIYFLNNVKIDSQHLDFEQLLNNLDTFIFTKSDLLSDNNIIKLELYSFLINKYKKEFDDKKNNSNYLVSTRKIVKNFIIKDIEQKNIIYKEANILFNNGINIEKDKQNIINKFIVCSRIKKQDNNENEQNQNNEQVYESIYNDLKNVYMNCKNIVDNLDILLQYYLFFGNEKKNNDIKEIEELINELKETKIKDFFKDENNVKIEKFKNLFEYANKVCLLKNSLCFLEIYEEMKQKLNDPNIKINIGNLLENEYINQKIDLTLSTFNKLISLFELFNNSNLETFINPLIYYFYNIELNKGEDILKKEIDFIINFFINNSKNEKDIEICKNLNKDKFVEFVKNLTKKEKLLLKCKGIKHIINIFLNPDNYIYVNKEEKKLEQQLTFIPKKDNKIEKENFNEDWSLLDFEKNFMSSKTLKKDLEQMNNKTDNINNKKNVNNNNTFNEKINNKLNNSEFMNNLNKFIENLKTKYLSIMKINEIINKIDKYNLGINIKDNSHNDNINLNESEKLMEKFFMTLMEKPEAIYYAKLKKSNEIKNLFNNSCIEIENTILKDNDIDDFILCLEKINNFSLNVEKMINNENIIDLPKELASQFINELNNNKLYMKSLINYLNKFNQIKSILNEIIASPEVSIKKITKILNNSDFIINYNKTKNKYLLFTVYYDQIENSNDIKEIYISYKELENLRERLLTINKNIKIYQDALLFTQIFNNIKKVLETIEDLEKTGYPDKINIIINIKNKKINCNYDNKKIFKKIKDLTNALIEQRNIQNHSFEHFYKDNEVIRLFYGKQISLLYNYIRYKEDSDYVDSLFQLISNGRINSSYPPQYQNYSENLFEDMINNVCNYCLLVLVSNQIAESNMIFYLNTIKIKNEKNEDYKGIYLHLSSIDNSEKEIIAYYYKFTNNLPLYSTILLCSSDTTEEEIISFLHRSILCENNILFVIVNSNFLEPKQRNTLISTIKNLTTYLYMQNKDMNSSLVIFNTESNSEIFRALKNYDSPEHPINILYINDIDNNLNNDKLCYINLDNFSIVRSDSSGVGKSRYIRNLKGVFESNTIYLPLGGNLTRKSIYKRLYDSIQKLNIKNLTQIFLHIDLSQTNEHDVLKEFLFELLVFKKYSMSSKNSDRIIYIPKKFTILIELPHESLNKVGSININNYINKYSIFTLFQQKNYKDILLANLTAFYEEMSEQEKKNLIMNPDFEFIKKTSDSQLQLVTKTLQLYKNKTINSTPIIITSTESLSNLDCNNILNEFLSKVHLPNFYQKNIFIKLLFGQFLSFHQNTYLDPKNLVSNAKKLKMKNYKNIIEIREKIIQNLIDHAVFFTNGFSENIMKSQERTKEIIQMQDYNQRKKLTEELKQRENITKIRYDQIRPSLLLFEEGGNDCKIIPTCQKNSEEELFLINLQKLLKVPKKGEISSKYNNIKYPTEMSSPELMDELLDYIKGTRLSLDVINRILTEYALTPDNFIKMILIYNRINADIPVILMGETGCGKTSLIKILANIIFKGYLNSNLKILNIHSGIEDKEIINFIDQLIKDAEVENNAKLTSALDEFNSFTPEQQNNYLLSQNKTKEQLIEQFKKSIDEKKIWVFFDEINASNSMGLLSEILCKKTYLGKKIPKKFVFLAACNPYRAMGELNKIDHTLIHKGQEKRKLVYTVYPLPNNMLNFVLDFGNLSMEEEKKYIQIMVRKMMEKIMIIKTKKESETIINLAINSILICQSYIKNTNDISSVSLREVKRFIIFFKYFVAYLLNKQNEKDSKDQYIYFYILKNNYEIYKCAVNLSLYICYYLRLPDNNSRKELLKYLDNENNFNKQFLIVPQLEENYIAQNILETKENEILSKGIAKNRALLENLFSLYFCTVNKIPLIICGKPGSTKSLSQKLLQNALKGMVSKTKLCKQTKELVVFPYQGSLNSTAEEIKEVFKKAKNYQKSNTDTIAMVYIDEIGLAEINKNNPLKVIHSELEMNFDFEINNSGDNLFNNNDNSKVAFLGISNWSLDASKMNRTIFNVIQEPDIKDLKKTSFEIALSINEKIANKYIAFFDKLTTAYYEYIEQKKRDDRIDVNFHGLRDFYNIIKSTTRELSSIDNIDNISNIKDILNNIAIKYIERNFGGLSSSVYDFKTKYFQIDNQNIDSQNKIDNNYDIMKCISENLFDEESRYLLLITKNNLDLDLINFLIDEIIQKNSDKYMNNKFETKYLIGSTFVKDNDEEYRENILSLIKNEMETNNLLILKNLDIIYTSLYDLLNQDFTKINNQYYTRISFGLWNPLTIINKKFKTIVLMNEKNVCYEDPPFLNRFEKHIFNLDNLLNEEEKYIANDIYNIVMSIVNFEKCKINLNKHLINFNLEELEALVYKYSKRKKLLHKNIDIIYKILKIIVPTFTEEIIASIFVSGFKEQKKDIADKILDIYSKYHPSNLSDFVNNKMSKQKNIIYTYSSISDDLLFSKSKKNKDEDNINIINENPNEINDYDNINGINEGYDIINEDINEINNYKRKNIYNEEENYNRIYEINDTNISFETKNTKEIYIESIKSILDLEKIIDEYLNEEHKNLFIIKFRNKEKDLNKMNQINYLIDDCISKFKNNNKHNKNKININKKYFIFIVYLIREDNDLNNKNNFNKKENQNQNVLSPGMISKLTNNCHHVFIDNLRAKDYDFIKTLTMKSNDLFEFFFIDELEKNIDTSFRFMLYEFSKNESSELNSQNYRQKMIEKILNNKYILNILKSSLLKLCIGAKEILRPIFIEEDKKNKNKKYNKIIYERDSKGYTDFIELYKKIIVEQIDFYLVKIIYCLEKSQILHSISFNNEMLSKKIITDKIIKYYIDNELENQLLMNKISTNFNMKNKLNIILSIKIPYISKNILIGKIFKYIKNEIIFNYSNNENKLIDVIKDNSLIEETINDYYNKLNQLNENIYIELINQEVIKDIIFSDDKYLITSLYQDLLLLYLLDGKRFENGDNFNDFYRFIDILVQLRLLNTQEDNFAFANKNKTISLLKLNDILFKNNIKDIKNKNKTGLIIAKILGFLFGYQNEILTLLEIFSYMSKYIPNLIKIFEDIIINKDIKNEISERNPDYCRIVKESFFIVYESLLHSITKQYNKYNIYESNKNENKINVNDDDSDLEEDDDDINIDDFTILNNNIINDYDYDNNEKDLLKQFGDIPIENIERISKISDLLEKKLLLYSKELFMIKNLSKIFEVLNKKQKNQLITKENINAITNIIFSEEKYIYEKNFKYLFNNFLLLMELLGKILGKDSNEFGEIIIYLIINQFLNIKNVSYKTKILNLIIPEINKKSKVKREPSPIILQKSLPLLVILFNDGKVNNNKPDRLQPLYNELSKEERKEKFLKFAKDEKAPQYPLLKVINRPNQILDQIILYYFEYLCELYFNKIKKENENAKNKEEEIIGNSSLDYLEESLLFLDDEINGNNNIGNKVNYLNKLGKLFSISYIKKYINNYVYINKNTLQKVFIWEDINDIMYSKDNKLRRMVKYYLLKKYSKTFDNENEFVKFNFNSKKIPFNSKFQGFKLELNKKLYDYNLFPFNYKNEYFKFSQDFSIKSFNQDKFYSFITDKNNINTIDFYFCFYVNNFLFQNFHNDFYIDENTYIYNYLKDQIKNLPTINENTKKLLQLLEPNEFFKSVKNFMGNRLNLKKYEIFIYGLRFCLISLNNNYSNFYSDLLSNQCFITLSENYIPGRPASRNIFRESYEIMKENLIKDPINYGAYICSCGYHYSVGNCTFPTVISKCPICNENIGGTDHRLYRRPGHMRVFLNSDSRKKKFDLSYADKGMNNMLLDEFYNNVVLKESNSEVRYIDKKRPMGPIKEDFLKREKIRDLTQIPYRILNFIYYSHLFISKIFNYISENNLSIFQVKDMDIFESLETDWDILDELLKEKKIKNPQIFLNIIYSNVYQLFNNIQFFKTDEKCKNFEILFENTINEILNNTKGIKEYEEINSNLMNFEPLSDMAIIYEKFPPYIYDKNTYPDFEFFINTITPDIETFKKKFSFLTNTEDKYPLLKIILTQDMDKIELLKLIPKFNKLSNYLLEKCSFKFSRESANNTKLKSEFNYNEIKDDLLNFIDSWNKIRPIIENYGCKQFKNNGVKYFTEINTNSPISYFLVDEGEFGYGMVLAAIYKKLIEFQNTFLNQIINSKSEILSCFKQQLNQEIMIQDASLNEIIDLNRINNNILNDIIIKNTIPNIFNTYKTEKKINFNNIRLFEHNYENIEKELGSLLLPGLRKFKPDELRFVTYKYEGFRGNKSSIITNFNEKYPQKELNKEQIKYIFDFINKEDEINKKNNTIKKNIKKILFSLQLLIDYIQRENYDHYENLYDIIKKLPKQMNICDEIKEFFKDPKNNKNEKEENEFNLLSNNDKGDYNLSSQNINKDIYFSISTLISIFELFEHLCWDSFKENLVGDYLQKIDPTWGKKIKQYFNNIDKNSNKIIKKTIFCSALRRFISRYLTGKRGENEINENNTLLNEILRSELWKPFFTESDSFEIEIGEMMPIMTDQYDGSLKVGQALELYNLLDGDQILLDYAKTNFVY